MATNSPTATADPVVDLACFETGGRVYGIEVAYVREIVRSRKLTPLPKAPQLIEGVIELRDTVIPVIDLGRALGGEPLAADPQSRIAVLEVDGMVFGLRVAAAVDVLSVGADAVREPPVLATEAGYDMLRAIVRRAEESPVLVLSIEHLLQSVYRSRLREGCQA